jgi:Linalool dehydratase/isomerase
MSTSPPLPLRRRLLLAAASLLLAAALWLPALHLFFRPPQSLPGTIPARAQKLAARQLELFRDAAGRGGEARRMRATNPEWDFMGRAFLAWSLANMALRDPASKAERLAAIDAIIDDTMRLRETEGLYYFLMPYARRRAFVNQPAQSLFLDGEIALMLGLRRLVEEKEAYRAPLHDLVAVMTARMQSGPVLSAESYPDECWTFCNAVALAAITVADRLDGTDHADFTRAWIARAKERLIDPATGLLVSSYTLSGKTLDGPEGSSIWMAAHALAVVDPAFAEDQYRRARSELGRTVLGFGYAREWPLSHRGPVDVDSGPIVPGLDVSGGSSGLAFVGAATFGDRVYLDALSATLDLAAFPAERDGKLRYAAGNQVGDAVVLYSQVLGPAWGAVRAKGAP